MKVAVIGAGAVGSAAANALVLDGVAQEIVLIDLDAARAGAEAADIAHAAPFGSAARVTSGDWSALAGSAAVVLTAGVAQAPGETRLDLLGRNAAVFRTVLAHVMAHAPGAILVVATNPVDVMTAIATHLSGKPPGEVIGTGTILDTARFRTLLSDHLGITPRSLHAYVLGEHGDSEVLAWSSARAGNVDMKEFAAQIGAPLTEDVMARIDQGVRHAAYEIIAGKGYTNYGIGAGIARILRSVLTDEQAVLSVSCLTGDVAGVADVAVSLPRVVGASGVSADLMPQLDTEEAKALAASAKLIRDLTEAVVL
ncbi:MAG: L-lactate dehydrogenase [Pseudomonadota bacterium]